MEEPGIPLNESFRLASLRSLNLLDTPAEERFDRATRIAQRMFRVPIAVVNLVDENRLWLKSVQGLDVCEAPRNTSFCGHAILGEGIFLIPDALSDHRFADNPMVTGAPHIRFYAGCPLRTPDGAKVGTLCLVDTVPREFGEEDALALLDLASIVQDELSARHTSTTDDLTQIANRRGFLQLAEYGLNFCVRNRQPAVLAFIDLDRFKPINDQFGHAEGDIALVAFAEVMQASFRSTDLFGRLGGDEFVVLLSGAGKSDAELVLQKFGNLLDAYNARSARGYDLQFSAGVVEFDPDAPQPVEALLAAGDAQMYAVKAARKRRHQSPVV